MQAYPSCGFLLTVYLFVAMIACSHTCMNKLRPAPLLRPLVSCLFDQRNDFIFDILPESAVFVKYGKTNDIPVFIQFI